MLPTFAFPFGDISSKSSLSDSIRVVRQFLVLFVLVRIQVGQQNLASDRVFQKCMIRFFLNRKLLTDHAIAV